MSLPPGCYSEHLTLKINTLQVALTLKRAKSGGAAEYDFSLEPKPSKPDHRYSHVVVKVSHVSRCLVNACVSSFIPTSNMGEHAVYISSLQEDNELPGSLVTDQHLIDDVRHRLQSLCQIPTNK